MKVCDEEMDIQNTSHSLHLPPLKQVPNFQIDKPLYLSTNYLFTP